MGENAIKWTIFSFFKKKLLRYAGILLLCCPLPVATLLSKNSIKFVGILTSNKYTLLVLFGMVMPLQSSYLLCFSAQMVNCN